jgi:predicted lipoprotein
MNLPKHLHLWIACASIGVLGVFACDDATGTPPPDYGTLLRTLTNDRILPAHRTFAARADDLLTATQALETAPSADTLTKAESAWRAARAAYRALDAAHFGPITDLAIGERIDATPAEPAAIDAIVAATTPIDGSVGAAGGKTKGFLGLEYLLFSTGGIDAALTRLASADASAARRRTLARAIAEEIASSAHQLDDAWDPSKGGYANEVIGAGQTSKRYASQRAVLDDLVGGVGYALEVVVGLRLAMPLGRRSGGTPDANQDFTRASDSAMADMTASIDGVRAMYHDDGFSLAVRPKSGALDAQVGAELTDCSSKIAAIPPTFVNSITNDISSVQAAYAACKDLKTTWNVEVTSALGATLKPSDNDGD